jgi:hypothetical protein
MTDRRTWLRRYIIICWVILVVSFIGWPVAALILYDDVHVVVFVLGWIANVLIAVRLLIDAYLRNGGNHNAPPPRDLGGGGQDG